MPTDPRLARALLDGAPVVGARRAAEVVALLSEDVRAPGGDLVAALRGLRRGGPDTERWTVADRATARRAARPSAPRPDGTLTDDLAAAFVVALAYPDRIARLRPGGSAYLMASGTGATLPAGSPLTGFGWLAVADADRGAGRRDATIRSAAPFDVDLAIEAAPALLREDEQRHLAGRPRRGAPGPALGAIELSSTRLADPDPALVLAAVRRGPPDATASRSLRWTDGARALRQRLAFLHRALGAPWPDVCDDALLARVSTPGSGRTWPGPQPDPRSIDVTSALRRLLPWPEAGRLDALAPERLVVPSGSSVRVDYEGDQPVLAVRLQEAFGWRETPRLADGRVPVLLHLLSPAGRPAAVTADLASFWRTGYPQVRAELRGRYPKHAWPEDPLTAEPTRGVRRAAR